MNSKTLTRKAERSSARFFLNLLSNLLPAIVLTLSMTAAAHASTVQQMHFNEVVATAELVFEGRVLSVESRLGAEGMIHTVVNFSVLDVLKGDYEQDEIELSFLGGQIGTRRLEITDMQIPEVGETGFYFVESLLTSQVNPLVGWAQGHYLIAAGTGGDAIVTTVSHEPIVAVDAAEVPGPPPLPMTSEFSDGVASGVVVQGVVVPGTGIASRLRRAMSPEEFRDAVRVSVEEQQ